ncbi:MAG: carbon-nitrogen hydrolase family protein [Planctomycetes bacterium]|nr:carbon-nitrogen hydrolase family protein [Planctomycetota bacterium]
MDGSGPPRKIVVGTVIRGYYGTDPEGARNGIAVDLIERVAAEAERKYPGRGADLIALPESAVNSGKRGAPPVRSVELEGPILDTFGGLARKHNTYIVLPMSLATDRKRGIYHNAAVLIDRTGGVAGIYRKVHVVAHIMTDILEGGMTPGEDFPVFDCDFGRLGIQICYDVCYADGWEALAAKGAEVVVWPTASPATAAPARHAARGEYFVVSAPWRDNATIFEPTGLISAQITPPADILVHEIDLASMVLPWSEYLRNGEAFREAFGDRAGFHYEPMEDVGLFWSNDPTTPISEMARRIGVRSLRDELERNRRLQDAARGGPPNAV